MTLEPYQEEAVAWLSKRKRGMVVAPAGSGKTLIAAAALHRVLGAKPRAAKVKVGWMANTVDQCAQAVLALAEFPDMAAVAEFKVACAAAGTDWSDRAVLVVDECHHATAPGWSAQILSHHGARWGFTATPGEESADALDLLFGDVHVVGREEVASRVAPAEVSVLTATDHGVGMKIDGEIARLKPSWDQKARFGRSSGEVYQRLAWFVGVKLGIVENKARSAAAVAKAQWHVGQQDRVLVLVNHVEHAKAIAEAVPARAVYAALGKKARREAIAGFRAGAVRCLVATSLADEGLDLPEANVLVLVSGGRHAGKVEQRTGRVLRAAPGKTHGLIYDFADRFHPMMQKHAERRVAVYKKLGYQVSYA